MKKQIIKSASEIMFREGIRKLTMDTLAKNLRISKKTLYTFFKSKDQLVQEVVNNEVSSLFSKQSEGLKNSDNAIEKISAVFLPVYFTIGKIDRVFFEDMIQLYPQIWKEIEEVRKQRLEILEDILEQGMEEGVFRPMNCKATAYLFSQCIHDFINPHILSLLGINPGEGISVIFSTFFMGILKKGEQSRLINIFNSNDLKISL